jgi:predicted dehydrogenase
MHLKSGGIDMTGPQISRAHKNSESPSRRTLLARSMLAASAMALAPHVLGQDQAPRKLGFCVVGIGNLSTHQLLPALKRHTQNCKLTAIVTGHPKEKAPPIMKDFGLKRDKVYTYDNFDTIKNDADIDVVYIVLPNSMHPEYTIRAFQAGKDVLCEKPMATSVADCEKMIEAQKQANKKLMIAYRLHYEPFNTAAIKILRGGELGQIKYIEAGAGFVIGDPTQWRLKQQYSGGGSLMDIGIYGLNAIRYLSGEEPAEVTAVSYSTPDDPRFKECEETILFDMRMGSGYVTTCTSTYGFGINRYKVICTDGNIEMDPFLSYDGLKGWVQRKRGQREELPLQNVDQFAAEMDAYSLALQRGQDVPTTGEEGLKDVRVMMAIYEAARTGQKIKI